MDLTELNQALADTVTSNNNTVTITTSRRNTADAFKFHQLPCSEVECMLATVNTNTGTGPDGIPAFLIRKLAPVLAPNVTKIINSSLSSSVFPDGWKKYMLHQSGK